MSSNIEQIAALKLVGEDGHGGALLPCIGGVFLSCRDTRKF